MVALIPAVVMVAATGLSVLAHTSIIVAIARTVIVVALIAMSWR
ncbi:MAG: hypothetical protein ACJ71D_07150 [Nitrososphaera sp.]